MKTYLGMLCVTLVVLGGMIGTVYAQPSIHEGGMVVVVTELVEQIESMGGGVPVLETDAPVCASADSDLAPTDALPGPSFSVPVEQDMTVSPDISVSQPELPEVLDVQVADTSEVPEPGTFALLLLGLIGMAGIARKRHLF